MKRRPWVSRVTGGMLALLLVAGCRELDAPTAPAGPAAQPLLGGLITTVTTTTQKLTATLLLCQPLPASRVEQQIGPAGGVVQVGPHRLEIPRGALSRQVTITAEVPSERVNSVRFSPEGLRFAEPARLTMSYANCSLAILLPKRIVYTTESLSLLEILRSVDNVGQKTVTAPLDHFSRYAVAW